jgi:ADP-ribose pyrophosphatase YjhB (NUDIX family)
MRVSDVLALAVIPQWKVDYRGNVPGRVITAGGPGSGRHKLEDVLPPGKHNHVARKMPIHPTWKWPKSWRQQAYGGVVVNKQGQFLIREPANHFDGYMHTWPKGKMDSKDEHPVDTATREVQEETGRKVRVIDPLPGTYKSASGSHTNMFIMRSAGMVQQPDKETASVKWLSYADAKEHISQSTNKEGRARDLAILENAHKHLQEYGRHEVTE